MADLKSLFQQATDEADAFSEEGARAHHVVDQTVRLAAALGDAIEAGAAEARQRMELLSTRLLEGEQELARESAAALGGLASLKTSSTEVQERVTRYLSRVHAQLAELRDEKDRLREEMQQQGTAVEEHASRYADHVRDVEAGSRARLEVARQVVASFRGMVEASRGTLYERRDVLLDTMKQMEVDARQRLDFVIQAYDGVGTTVQDQVAELHATLKVLTDQAITGLHRRLSQDAVQSLENAADPLRDAISELEKFCKESRSTCGDRLQEITRKVEDVTSVLERLRHPLDQIRQHLQ
jgi:predicted  nucleic acid-binding Zn-ribbon protein